MVSRFFGGNEEMGTLEAPRESSKFDVIGINRKSVFSLNEANTLFPVIYRLTKSYSERAQALVVKLEAHSKNRENVDDQIGESIEKEIERLVQEWQSKVQKLGGLPNGHWIVDFDSGDGYFCWKYPERAIEYWHHYRDGFSKRIQISSLSTFEPSNRLAPVETAAHLKLD